MRAFSFIAASIIALGVAGCSSIDCNIEGRVMCHYAIQDAEGGQVSLAYPMSITFHRVAMDNDTVYINKMSNVVSFDLPMSYDAETDEIAMTLHLTETDSVTDVLRITKSNTAQFESVDCAPRYHHQIQDVSSTHNFIDTVIINNPKVSNDASVTNLHIRLRNSDSQPVDDAR